MGYVPFHLKFALKLTHPLFEKRRLRPISALSTVRASEKMFSYGKYQILVLDEATAAIDSEMDSMIQSTISEVFSECTMLVIAHRLNTVLNCHRILVLDAGQVMSSSSSSCML